MNQFLPAALVALGGGLGALARWKLGGIVLHHTANWKFPVSTFLVNVAGCLVAGLLSGVSAKYWLIKPHQQLFLFTGLLGGFTTFSAFGLETTQLLRRGHLLIALAYVAASVVTGVLALWIAMAAVPAKAE